MSSRRDQEGGVGFGNWIDMDAQRDHLSQHFEGRRHMKSAVFARPRPVVLDIDALADSDHPILMPRKRPIRGWRLVEEDGAHWLRATFERACGNHSEGSAYLQELAQAVNAEQAHARDVCRLIGQNALEPPKCGSVESCGDSLSTMWDELEVRLVDWHSAP